MKIISILFLLAVSFSCGQQNVDVNPQNEQQALQEVMQMERKFSVAFKRKDIKAMDEVLGDEFQLTFPNGKTMTKNELIRGFKEGTIEIELDSLEELNFRLFGNVAVLTGYANIKAKVRDERFEGWYRGVGVVVKRDGKWHPVDEYFGLTDYKPKKTDK